MKKIIFAVLSVFSLSFQLFSQQDIQTAIEKTDTRFMKEWLSKGHDVNSVLFLSGQKMTPLHFVAAQGNAEMVQLLLKHGADIHLKVDFQDALMFAAASGNIEIIESLLQAGANPMNENRNGKCARDIAQDNKRTAAYNLLKTETDKRLGLMRAQRRK